MRVLAYCAALLIAACTSQVALAANPDNGSTLKRRKTIGRSVSPRWAGCFMAESFAGFLGGGSGHCELSGRPSFMVRVD